MGSSSCCQMTTSCQCAIALVFFCMHICLEQFSMECRRKTKIEVLTVANQKLTQSELEANTCCWREWVRFCIVLTRGRPRLTLWLLGQNGGVKIIKIFIPCLEDTANQKPRMSLHILLYAMVNTLYSTKVSRRSSRPPSFPAQRLAECSGHL